LRVRLDRRLAQAVAADFARHDLLTYSSAIAFQVLYAVVPLALLALAGLGLLGEQSVYTQHIAPSLRHDLSRQAFTIANHTALKTMNGGRLWWGTAGLALTLWGVGSSLRAMMTPLNAVYGAQETRSWWERIAISLCGGVAVVACVLGAMLAVLGGRLIGASGLAAVALFLARWLVALVLLLLANAVLIRLVPAKKRPARWVSIGSGLATVCWIGATVGFGAYISAVSYTSFYGALASIVLLLIYLHVSAIAFLLGVTVDSALRSELRSRRTGTRRPRPGRRRAGR
jgi:membrane protein